MDGRSASDAHPAFVEIIKQLDSEDARLIRGVLQSTSVIPIVQIHRKIKSGGYFVLVPHLLNLINTETELPAEDQRLPAMIDNWVRLGLVEVAYDKHLHGEIHYSWVEQRPEFEKLKQELQSDETTVTYQKGLLNPTELGKRFAKAIGLL
jgi:hypothetical protein